MSLGVLNRILTYCVIVLLCWSAPCVGQDHSGKAAHNQKTLRFVVILSRHGVRSPTGDPGRFAKYARAAWPTWDVPPGYLTPHGFEDMKLLGVWDRAMLAKEGLLAPSGCAGAAQVDFVADSDQRTRESGRALAEGMFPGCAPAVHALAQGNRDPLFHPMRSDVTRPSPAASGGPAAVEATERNLMLRYRPRIAEMDHILATCGPPASPDSHRESLFGVPNHTPTGKPPHPGELRGPLSVAATLSENFLLEYTQGMPMRDVGWGCVSEPTLRSLVALHTAAFEYEHRKQVARRGVSNLLDGIRAAMEQAVVGQPLSGAPDPLDARALFLVGHDSNLAGVAGVLDLHWYADGRRDDTPPGSALAFELWQRKAGDYFVRIFYTAQTLDQMRKAAVLTLAHPPQRVPLTVSGCRQVRGECSWDSFLQILQRNIGGSSAKPVNARVHAGR